MKRPKSPELFGLVQPGNIDPLKRPVVHNKDGSYSTTRSMSFEEDGVQVLIPTIDHDGKSLTPKQAIDYYHRTGEHLGKFDTPDNADRSAINIHNYQAKFYTPDGKIRNDIEGGPATDTLRRNKPFTEMYPQWDTPTFDPARSYIQPKAPTATNNRTVMSRLYEKVLDDFSDARMKLLREQIDAPNNRPQVWGTRGSVPTQIKLADAPSIDPPVGPPDRPIVWGTNG